MDLIHGLDVFALLTMEKGTDRTIAQDQRLWRKKTVAPLPHLSPPRSTRRARCDETSGPLFQGKDQADDYVLAAPSLPSSKP